MKSYLEEKYDSMSKAEKNEFNREITGLTKDYRQLAKDIGSINAYKAIIDGIDLHLEVGIKHSPQPISCRKGCNFCCKLHIEVLDVEAEILADKVTEDMIPILERQQDKTMDTWHELSKEDRACVFLKDGQCSVYEDRPYSCRKYYVITPPELCDTEKNLKTLVSSIHILPVEMMSVVFFGKHKKFGSLSKMLLKTINKPK